MPFQHGFIYTIHSLKGLFLDVKESPLNATYIMTHRLNQDLAENAFGVIRSLGRYNTHPTPLEATHRLKTLSLGWTFKPPSRNVSTESRLESQPFLSSGLLKPLMEAHSCPQIDPISEEMETSLHEISTNIESHINEETWKEYNESLSFDGRFGEQAQEYVFGFIVSKLKDKYPNLVLDPKLQTRVPCRYAHNLFLILAVHNSINVPIKITAGLSRNQ
jgi:hypothetical protein